MTNNNSTSEEQSCDSSSSPKIFEIDSSPLEEVLQDAKEIRQRAFKDARKALEESFTPKLNAMISKSFDDSSCTNMVKQKVSKNCTSGSREEVIENYGVITEQEVNELVKELEADVDITKVPEKDVIKVPPLNSETREARLVNRAVEETKALMKNFREKVANYPKYISYEGSMVLCVLLSMKEVAHPHISNLPSVDQQTIRSLLPRKMANELDYFNVKFDENKDFIMEVFSGTHDPSIKFTMFNTVAHPRQEDLKDTIGTVPIEKDGNKVAVGGKIIMDKRNIQKLMGIAPKEVKHEELDQEPLMRRQPVSGRNAFEIREDILESAIDVVKFSSGNEKRDLDEVSDEVLRVAKKFYCFVENKSR
jgi:hypothetical protein